MEYPKIIHDGGASEVTGSCHQWFADDQHSVLVDCGLFQGQDAGDTHEDVLSIDFPIDSILALVVTHVHIDHIGRLPYLLAAGFRGPIICSPPTALLLPLVIEDALKIGFTRNSRLIEQFLQQVEHQLLVLPYKEWHCLVDKSNLAVKVKLQRAGHILGSAYVEIDVTYPKHIIDSPSNNVPDLSSDRNPKHNSHRTVFSGDLGAPWSPLLPAPRSPYRADLLVLESTYGNRLHENRRVRANKLAYILRDALSRSGCIIIPAFSIGRTQELLYELEGIIHAAPEDSPLKELEVLVDSPLAARFTEVYRQLKPYWDKEARQRLSRGRHPLSFDSLYTIDSHKEHLQTVDYLTRSQRSAVVIAASGMVSGGRVVNYLKAMVGDRRHQVIFVGYQAKGTPGADILRYGDTENGWVRLDGEKYTIRAHVDTISGYSAHADQNDLIRFTRGMRYPPKKVVLVHGELSARKALKQCLEETLVPIPMVTLPN